MSWQRGTESMPGHEDFERYSSAPQAAMLDRRRQLRRSQQDRIIAGVTGGLARYFDVEPIVFRIAFLVLLAPGGLGLLLYFIAWISMPEFKTEEEESRDNLARPLSSRMAGLVIGGILILIGMFILLERLIDWFDLRVIGGILLIAIGALIVLRGLQREAVE